MGLIDRIKEKFSRERRELEISWENSTNVFEDEKETEIRGARERAEKFTEETEEVLENIEEGLEAFNEYEDSEDIQLVEDVAQNFYRSRKRMVENFNPSEDIEEHLEDLEDFIEEFNDVSRKEGEVMKHVRKDAPQLSDSLDELLEHKEKIQSFVDTDYQVLVQLEMIKDYQKEIEEIREELEEAEKDLEGKDTRSIKDDIEDMEEKIDELEESSRWKELKTLEREKEELIDEKERKRRQLKSSISEMDRGLKKLIYNIENEGLEFKGDKTKLKKLKDREIEKIDNPEDEVEEALERIKDEDLISKRQLEKFRAGAEDLENFTGYKEDIEELERELDDIRSEMESMDVEEEREEIRESKEKLEKDLKEKKEEIRTLEETRNKAEDRLQAKMLELEHFMDSLLKADIKVKEIEDSAREKA